MHVPKNIITLLTQLSPLNYVSLDLRHMTRAQDVVFYKHFAGPSGRHHQVEIGLLRLSCPDFLSGIIIHWVKPTALYGLQIDTGLEGAAYLHGAVLMRNTLKRLAIRLTSKELALLDPRHPKEYDRAFFPITSRVLSIILGHFPLLTWLTVDVAASIEEPWVGDLELPMEHANNHSLQIHPKVEATVVEIAKVLNGCKSLRRVALTWRGGRSDWLMCSSTHPYRTRNFMTLIQALFRACPGLEGIAFLTEYMSYYSGLRQNDGSMMFKVGSSGMDRPGEWPAGLRGPLDYSEGVVQDTSAPDRVPSTDSSTSANVVPNGGRVDRNAVSYERLVAARHGASDRIAGQMFEKGAVNMQAYEENLIKWLYSGRPGFGLQPQATVSAQWIPPLPTARKTSDGLQTTSGTQKEEQE
ncbi:hypothetical protein MCOR25_007451 [Pyricularia grisea]|nr:hypothetical protein MCOR25_007451 [Pyricularia grisea]